MSEDAHNSDNLKPLEMDYHDAVGFFTTHIGTILSHLIDKLCEGDSPANFKTMIQDEMGAIFTLSASITVGPEGIEAFKKRVADNNRGIIPGLTANPRPDMPYDGIKRG